jgi:SOS-response transcriptional repressor LexA
MNLLVASMDEKEMVIPRFVSSIKKIEVVAEDPRSHSILLEV